MKQSTSWSHSQWPIDLSTSSTSSMTLRSWFLEFSKTFDRFPPGTMAKFAPLRSFLREIIILVRCGHCDILLDQSPFDELAFCNSKRHFMYESQGCSVTGHSLISIRKPNTAFVTKQFQSDQGWRFRTLRRITRISVTDWIVLEYRIRGTPNKTIFNLRVFKYAFVLRKIDLSELSSNFTPLRGEVNYDNRDM